MGDKLDAKNTPPRRNYGKETNGDASYQFWTTWVKQGSLPGGTSLIMKPYWSTVMRIDSNNAPETVEVEHVEEI